MSKNKKMFFPTLRQRAKNSGFDIENQTHCAFCQREFEFSDIKTIDHIIPKYLGGKDSIENFWALHTWCNTMKGKRIVWYSFGAKKFRLVKEFSK